MERVDNDQRTAASPSSLDSTLATFHRSPVRWLVYAIWFALAASLGEIAFLTRWLWLRYRFPEPQYMWWLPLGYLTLLIPVTALAVLLLRRRPASHFYVGIVGVLAFVASFGLATVVRKFEYLAAAVLALGAASQIARLALWKAPTVDRVLRRSFPVLALASITLAAVSWGTPVIEERRALAALPAARADAPNVLLIVLDTVRAKSLGLYGYRQAATPHLDRLAARSVVFDRAMATAPWTLPSHGSMFTGRWPHELHTGFNAPLDARFPTLAEVFGHRGYLTAGFSANSAYGDREFGLARGFAHFEGRPTTATVAVLKTSPGRLFEQWFKISAFVSPNRKYDARSAAEINGAFVSWLSARPAGHPFFAFLNYFDAHDPYVVDDEIGRSYTTDERQTHFKRALATYTAPEMVRLNRAYDAALASLDAQVGALLDELERRGESARTLVVLTSDHGEQFGEHGLLKHSSSLYTPLLHVPLLISYPPVTPAHVRVGRFITLRDLPATILDLAQVQQSQDALPGRSLRPCWAAASSPGSCGGSPVVSEVERGNSDLPDWYPSRRGRMRSIVVDGMHYIRNEGDGREELYNLENDLEENLDLAGSNGASLIKYRDALRDARNQ